MISLEITGTPLADQVLPPRLVRELDWVEKFWPNTKKGKGHVYPKVQLYCLMGVANAWTVSRLFVSQSFILLMHPAGLACGLRRLLSVLSCFAWLEGIF